MFWKQQEYYNIENVKFHADEQKPVAVDLQEGKDAKKIFWRWLAWFYRMCEVIE